MILPLDFDYPVISVGVLWMGRNNITYLTDGIDLIMKKFEFTVYRPGVWSGGQWNSGTAYEITQCLRFLFEMMCKQHMAERIPEFGVDIKPWGELHLVIETEWLEGLINPAKNNAVRTNTST